MTTNEAYKTYKNMLISTTVDKMQIISLLYEGALNFAAKAKLYMKKNSIKEKCENMDKLIAVLSALRDSLDQNTKDKETIDFLSGLYDFLLVEIFNANKDNNIQKLEKIIRYLTTMSQIWNTDVMKNKNPF